MTAEELTVKTTKYDSWLADLRRKALEASSAIQGFYLTSESRKQRNDALNALGSIQKQLIPSLKVLMRRVLAGDATEARFIDEVATAHRSIDSLVKDVPNWSFSGIVESTIRESGKEAGKVFAVGAGITGAVLLGIVALYIVLAVRR